MELHHYRRTFSAVAVGVLTLATSVAVPSAWASANSAYAHVTKSASTSSIRGVVVARDATRHTLAVSSGAQRVSTLRLASSGAVNKVALGSNVIAKTSKLADGTFHVVSLTNHGVMRHTKFRATVVRAASSRLTLSAGGSVFTVAGAKRSSHDSSGSASSSTTGDVVEVSVSIGAQGLDETSLQQVGTSNLLELEGTLTSLSATSLVLAVDSGASTTITIPASLTLPSSIVAGNQVEVLADYANSTFTLVTITDDASAGNSSASGVSSSDQGQASTMEIEGLVVAANATSVTIQPGDQAAPVIVAVPSTIDVSTLSVGARVHARADMVNGVLTLTSLDVQSSDAQDGQSMMTEVEGVVVSVSSTSLVIQPGDQGTPVTMAVPSTIDVSSIAVGARIHARGAILNSVLTLSSFRVQGQEDQNASPSMEVDGAVTAVSASSLTIQPSDNAAPVVLVVPSTIDVSAIQIGNEIKATATLLAGVLTLANFELHGQGDHATELSGVVSTVTATSLTILAGDHSQAVVLVVPSTVDVSTLAAGDHVNVTAAMIAGVLTLESVSVDS
ncbi:MAG TPA: hypothetical protein VNE22_00215 [Acidimicrobiales bacterium]|nr:hypothetical protein [Acidimicrobiales bacterium]